MLLEYLIETEENADKVVAEIAGSELHVSKKKLNDNHFIVSIELKGESEITAKALSDINERIVNFITLIVLSNGPAAYFNKVLFPLVNDFERKLRKLLYAASALKPSEKDVIGNLENKDFGRIFDALFLDNDYLNRVKAFVVGNKKNGEIWSGYSYELHGFLSNETENPLWDRLLPGQVPTLRKQFSQIRLKRNDIMHAHNISKSEYISIRKLFNTVNQELDYSIEKLADGALIPNSYNQEIEDAIFLVTENGEYLSTEDGVPLICEFRRKM